MEDYEVFPWGKYHGQRMRRGGQSPLYTLSVTEPGRSRGKTIASGLTLDEARAALDEVSLDPGYRIRLNYKFPTQGPMLYEEYLVTDEGTLRRVYKKGMGSYKERRLE